MNKEYKLFKGEKFINSFQSLKEAIFYLWNINDNLLYLINNKYYSIVYKDKEIKLTCEEMHNFENEFKEELYFKRLNKLKSIIEKLNLKYSDNSIIDGKIYVQPNNIRCYGENENGNIIRLNMVYNNKNKITVDCEFKRDNENNFISHKDISIKISFDKDIERIIKDINRRFIPNFLEVEKEVMKKVNQSNNYIYDTIKRLKELKALFNDKELTDEEIRSKKLYVYSENISAIEVLGDSVYLNLYSLNVEKAKKVIEALK